MTERIDAHSARSRMLADNAERSLYLLLYAIRLVNSNFLTSTKADEDITAVIFTKITQKVGITVCNIMQVY